MTIFQRRWPRVSSVVGGGFWWPAASVSHPLRPAGHWLRSVSHPLQPPRQWLSIKIFELNGNLLKLGFSCGKFCVIHVVLIILFRETFGCCIAQLLFQWLVLVEYCIFCLKWKYFSAETAIGATGSVFGGRQRRRFKFDVRPNRIRSTFGSGAAEKNDSGDESGRRFREKKIIERRLDEEEKTIPLGFGRSRTDEFGRAFGAKRKNFYSIAGANRSFTHRVFADADRKADPRLQSDADAVENRIFR